MPKNPACPGVPWVTDQEMAFAHLVLSGTMNDRRPAEAVGLNPDSATYTKSNRVHAPTTSFFNVALDAINSVKLPYSAKLSEFARSR